MKEFKTTLVMVQSLNGKTTKGENPDVGSWASEEDQEYLKEIRSKHEVIVFGRKTYDAVKEFVDFEDGRLRIVLTSSPKKYQKESVPGKLEFTDEKSTDLVERLQRSGHNELLLFGGAKVNSLFLKDGLIHEIHTTVEPVVFGEGRPLFEDVDIDASLEMIEKPQMLNKKGTLLLKHKVLDK